MNSSSNQQVKLNDDLVHQIQKSDLVRFQEENRRAADREVNIRKDLTLQEEHRMVEERRKWENELNRQKYVSNLEATLRVFMEKERRERSKQEFYSRKVLPFIII